MKIKVAILDSEQNYLNRIVSVFSNRFADKLEIYSFTDQKVALDTLKSAKIDVFISSGEFIIDIKAMPDRCGFAYFVDSTEVESLYNQRTICKYQKAELIYKEILSLYAEDSAIITGQKNGNNASTNVISFLSASGGTGSSTVCAAGAVNLARRGKRVLYLNIEQFGEANMFFHAEGSMDLSDVIYAIKSNKSNLALKLESAVKQDASGVYYYDCCKTALDVTEIREDDIKRLLHELTMTDSFDYIVIDTNFIFNNRMNEIMHYSNHIIFVSDGSEIANAKFERAMAALNLYEQQKNTRILSKISLIYNQFRSKTSRTIENQGINVLGGVPKFEGAQTAQAVQEISKTDIFNQLVG